MSAEMQRAIFMCQWPRQGPPPAWDSVESAGLREWICHTGLIFMDKPILSSLFHMMNACEAVGSARAGALSASPLW